MLFVNRIINASFPGKSLKSGFVFEDDVIFYRKKTMEQILCCACIDCLTLLSTRIRETAHHLAYMIGRLYGFFPLLCTFFQYYDRVTMIFFAGMVYF